MKTCMSSSYDIYDTVYEDGSKNSSSRDFIVRLYPNTSSETGDVKSGGVAAEALVNVANQLKNAGVIDYYHILRWRYEDHGYPNISSSDGNDPGVGNCFIPWMEDDENELNTLGCTGGNTENGESSPYYLRDWKGVHLLVHSIDCPRYTYDGQLNDYAGANENIDYKSSSAFNTAVCSHTTVSCSDDLSRASAIQETLHQFIRYGESGSSTETAVYNLCDSTSDSFYDEHRLGQVESGYVTPLLTYHANESSQNGEGDCDATSSSIYGFKDQVTQCTIDALEVTVNNE